MATVLLSGAALVAVQAGGRGSGWWALVVVKTVLLAVALGLFANVSWRLWPTRLFAAPEELPALRRRFSLAAYALAGLVGVEVVLGVGLRYL